jgi:tetratricopeptide (TPR) repeat protein
MRFRKLAIVFGSIVAAGSPCAWGQDFAGAPRVRSSRFDVTYTVNESAAPLQNVVLWHRVPGELRWTWFGVDEDLQSPIEYVAEQEGLHDLFFVVTNSAGKSGPDPQAETVPHFSVFVDYTEPIIQLQRVRAFENAKGQTIVRIEWSAMDLHLDARPIQIAYRLENENDQKIAKAQLPNIGLYEWAVPDDVSGNVQFRITVTDQGGNMSAAESEWIPISRPPIPLAQAGPPINVNDSAPSERMKVPGANLSASRQHRLNQLINRGIALRKNHDDDRAMEQFLQALEIEPQHPEALVNLGRSLYALGRNDESAKAFQSALANAPEHPGALLGLAEAFINNQQFDAAESKLLDLVASGRHDATTWLRLGDVAAYKGQAFAAHDFYSKVLKSPSPESSSFDPIALAQARLAEMAVQQESKTEQGNRENERDRK